MNAGALAPSSPAAVRQQAPAAAAGSSMGLRPEAVTVVPRAGAHHRAGRAGAEALGAETLLHVAHRRRRCSWWPA